MFNAIITTCSEAMSSFMALLFQLASAVGLPYYGMAIILFTIVIKILLYPLTWKQTKSMRRMAELQPKMQELQKKFANDKQKLNQKMMELYSTENVNPYSGCLPILVQIPILYIFYNTLRTFPYGEDASAWFFGYHLPTTYGWDDFAHWPLPVLVGASVYVSSKISMAINKPPEVKTAKGKKLPPPPNPAEKTQKMMLTIMPFFLAYICFSLPSGMSFYFVTMNFVSALQSYYINRKLRRETEQRQAAIAAQEARKRGKTAEPPEEAEAPEQTAEPEKTKTVKLKKTMKLKESKTPSKT
ncbi:MAG: YidC/Oxa1 family membrane protein insertase [Gracilibacteraceae bacterium]|jgi:YidC/Oxa1 family membrane protein insertase|nr:YidC/Oxa1 family membrane protein insertase [Gracilibacteraceae bacterium]